MKCKFKIICCNCGESQEIKDTYGFLEKDNKILFLPTSFYLVNIECDKCGNELYID